MDDNKSRDHFTFFRSFREQIDLCNEHDQLRLYRAISDFALFHKDTEFDDPLLNMAWIGIKPFLEKSWTNYTNGIRSKGVPKPGMCGNKNAKKQSENKANSKPIQSENKTIGMECNGMDSIVEDNNKETETKKDISLSIYDRKEAFKNELEQYREQYDADMLNDFFQHWTQPNKSKTKMKFEGEKYWDTKSRLDAWKNRKFNK